MKKLLIAVAAVACGIAANAATCEWKSGTMFQALNGDGGWDKTSAAQMKNNGSPAYMAVFYVETLEGLKTDQASLWATYGNDDITKLGTARDGKTTTTHTGNSGTASTITITDSAASPGTYYAVIVAAYHDQSLEKDFYIATVGSAEVLQATGEGALSNIISTVGTRSTDGGWKAVPEPTSGLLLLLGVAGLALRRRRA